VARVLAMSSWVSAGHVGLSAMAPILQSFGHEIIQLPTVVLSNHTGWPAIAGRETPPDQLTEMLDANSSNGWLAGVDTFLGGYLPSVRHVEVARQAIDKLLEQSPVARIEPPRVYRRVKLSKDEPYDPKKAHPFLHG
jgi:pyridoxine kinase